MKPRGWSIIGKRRARWQKEGTNNVAIPNVGPSIIQPDETEYVMHVGMANGGADVASSPYIEREDVARPRDNIVQERPIDMATQSRRRADKILADHEARAAAPAPERISAADLAELVQLHGAWQQAQERVALTQEAAAAMAAGGAYDYIVQRARQRYALGPRDVIGSDGTISRVVAQG
jgi:hypothetical protein